VERLQELLAYAQVSMCAVRDRVRVRDRVTGRVGVRDRVRVRVRVRDRVGVRDRVRV
jgi:hypothetical protein